MQTLALSGAPLSLAQLRDATAAPLRIEATADLFASIRASHEVVGRLAAGEAAVYGINTGFGLMAQTRIPRASLDALQRNLVLSHAAGTGAPLSDEVVRLILVLKLMSLARGNSGVSPEVFNALLTLVNSGACPCIPEKGSVGASGDLAPLAHLAAGLLGEGQIRLRGVAMPAPAALAAIGLAPLQLGPKEGLALLNGTQVSTALALSGLFATERVFAAAVVAGALSVDAVKGSDVPFDARIHAARGQAGQERVAAVYRGLLTGSTIRASHLDCGKIQDPYSLRCQPQVMGACLDLMENAARTLCIEANAVTDNPLVFGEEVLSGGNFHAQPVAFAADTLALALAEIGSISERRTAVLVDPKMSGLPAFLVADSGLNSGFMMAQVTAAALVSENKSLAHPASIDSIPTSANQEDHVSMATYAARRLTPMAHNTATVIGIELLAAVQGIEFHHPLASSPALERARAQIRRVVRAYDRDRFIHPDIEAAAALVEAGGLSHIAGNLFAA